ncbi:uncharacterized protein LOC143768934 isoform X1 [Ranitomeya variabilis]|uniref:uncharacterized protein LOC143768934 isoform X1 n=1 Tax=Ranitomeya variabilis TaxID=490064 RepID=UPI004056926C
MDNQERRRQILLFDVEKNSLEGNGYKRVLLQLFGFAGHGKSSFINSCIYTLQDGIFKVKATAAADDVTHTTKRLAYKLTDCITLVDNRGHVKMLDSETGEIYAQLGVYPIVVLTNKLSARYTELASKFKETGVEQIHVVENYTVSDNLKTRGRCNDLQVIIENALKDTKFRMEQKRDPIKERIDRKKFLLKFAYQFTVAEKEKEAVKKEKARLKALASKMWFGRFPE